MQDDLGPLSAEKRQEKRAQIAENQLEREKGDLLWLMNDARGRRHIYSLLSDTKVFGICYTAGDPHHTSFNEGRRNAGLRILNDVLRLAPEQYALMMREAQDVHS